MATNLDSLGFLNPAQAKDKLGRLGSYRVLKLLGRGGMGMVFLAEDPQLQRTVALKTMLPEVAKNPAARERFLREARATAKIEHDHIVTIYQVGEDRGMPFLAMQLLKGMTLEDFLNKKQGKTGTPLTVEQILRLGREIARGLQAAHERGLIHRDIKPANIWLDASANGRVKILDFGLARAADGESKLTQLGAIVGTAAFMAPEQARSDKIDGRADLFSLGCILYRLCTGRQPWKGGDAMETLVAIATDEPTPIRELNPDIPPKLAKLVAKLLAKKPEDRPDSAKAVAEAIQSIEREQPAQMMKAPAALSGPVAALVPAPAATSPGNTLHDASGATGMLVRRTQYKARGRRRPWTIVGGCAALVAAAVAASIIYGRPDTGTLKIETADPDVHVLIQQNGKLVKVLDRKHGTEVTLDAGIYQLRLGEGSKNVKLSDNQIQIVRGNKKVVTISREEEVASLPPKLPPTTAKLKQTTKRLWPRETTPVTKPKTDPPPVQRNDPPPASVKYLTNSIGMELAPIQPGEFVMGSTPEEMKRFNSPEFARLEGPAHRVKITKPFFIGRYPVTLKQYFDFLNASGYKPIFKRNQLPRIPYRQTPNYPVIYVTWEDAVAFCDWLSKKERRKYRLPTEAEWEYACRAGTQTAFFFGDDPGLLGKYGWFKDNWGNQAHPVGMRAPNPWGLYDMHGNVYQWTADWYAPDYYKNSPLEDPLGPGPTIHPGQKKPLKLMRGGEYAYDAATCRSAARKERPADDYATPRTGFRVVLEGPTR